MYHNNYPSLMAGAHPVRSFFLAGYGQKGPDPFPPTLHLNDIKVLTIFTVQTQKKKKSFQKEFGAFLFRYKCSVAVSALFRSAPAILAFEILSALAPGLGSTLFVICL